MSKVVVRVGVGRVVDDLGQGGEAAGGEHAGEVGAVGDLPLRAVGAFYQALLTGVLVQWLVDPERAPSGRDLADALRTIIADA